MEKVIAPEGKFEDGKFWFPVRIYYEDTDAGGIVYYANYLKYAERARTEFLRAINVEQSGDLQEVKQGFIVRKASLEYLKSAYLDDVLAVSCEIVEVKGASVAVKQEIWRGEELLTNIEVMVVYFDFNKMRPVRVPEKMAVKR